MAAGSLRLFRIAGIDIYLHFSWIVAFLLVTISLATGVLDALVGMVTIRELRPLATTAGRPRRSAR